MRSFAECAFLVSLAWRLPKQLGSAPPPFPSETRLFWLVAKQICHFAPPQQALLPRAFGQSSARRISFRAAWVWFAWVQPIPKGPALKTALLAWEPPVSFHEERLLPAPAFARQEQRCRVAA
jgi:hypothetical protein